MIKKAKKKLKTALNLQHYVISKQSFSKIQMVSFEDGGAVQLCQRIARPDKIIKTQMHIHESKNEF